MAAALSADAESVNVEMVRSGLQIFLTLRRPRKASAPAITSITTKTIRKASHRGSQMSKTSPIINQKKNRLNSPMAAAPMKNALPRTPVLTVAVSSSLASSSSERTSVERWTVASFTRAPIEADGSTSFSAISGMDGRALTPV